MKGAGAHFPVEHEGLDAGFVFPALVGAALLSFAGLAFGIAALASFITHAISSLPLIRGH